MKYQNATSFEKQLHDSFPDHLSPLYMVISSCPFERRFFAALIEGKIRQKDPSLTRLYINAAEEGISGALEEIQTDSLLGGSCLVFLDFLDKQKELSSLLAYIKKPSQHAFLILGASQIKPIQTLYQEGKKEIVVLDLSEEKAWDKEKRLKEWLIKEAKQEGKSLSGEAISFLLQQAALDFALLSQEFKKAVCYVGSRQDIALADVKALSFSRHKELSWDVAEELIWKEGSVDVLHLSESAVFFPFLSQVRYHLQLGAQLSQLSPHLSSEAVVQKLPHLKKYSVDKYADKARSKGDLYFLRGLKALYEIDLLSKSSTVNLETLFALFIGKLRA